jgi:hypothetical protein
VAEIHRIVKSQAVMFCHPETIFTNKLAIPLSSSRKMPSVTLHIQAELNAWLADVHKTISTTLKEDQ